MPSLDGDADEPPLFRAPSQSLLPSGTANQTLRNAGGEWRASSVLQNDGTNVTDTGNFTAQGNTHAFGTAGTAATTTLGQGAGGSEDSTCRIQSGASGSPRLYLRQNATNVSQMLAFSGTTRIDYGTTFQIAPSVDVGTPSLAVGAGSFTVGGVTGYNNITTVSNGVPAEYATVDTTAKAAAITSTLLYQVPAGGVGMYRVSGYAKVTTAGTTSILGGTTSLVLTYTDGTDSVAQTVTVGGFTQAGAVIVVANGNTGNSTTTVSYFPSAIVWAKASTAINYAFGYTSTGTAMQYELHLKLEAM